MISPDGRVHAHVESCYHGQASAGCEMYETYTYARDTRGFMAKASSDPPSSWSFTLHARRHSWPWHPCLWLCTLAVGVKDEKTFVPTGANPLVDAKLQAYMAPPALLSRADGSPRTLNELTSAAVTTTRTDDTEDASAVARRPDEDVQPRGTTHR